MSEDRERKVTVRLRSGLKHAFDVALAVNEHTAQEVLHAMIEQYIEDAGNEPEDGSTEDGWGPFTPPAGPYTDARMRLTTTEDVMPRVLEGEE